MGEMPLLSLTGISKTFGSLVANDVIHLTLHTGEILALLGENGAGKTTLMNILFGHYVADQGSIEVDGKALPPGSAKAALAAGLGMVHQHFTLADNMSVLDNIMLGTESMTALRRNKRAALQKIRGLIERYEIDVNPATLVKQLSVGQRQRVEILKALYRDTRILILDEPTAVLTPQEGEHLFATLKLLVRKGLAIIFITHKLREVMAVSDRCQVLRHGRTTYESRTRDTTIDTLAREMVGGAVPKVERVPAAAGAALLTLEHIFVADAGDYHLLDDISLQVRQGEIIGIAGVSGNGQSHLADLISGLLAPNSGRIIMHGEVISAPTPRGMVDRGVGRIPEDRTGTGLISEMSVRENLVSERYWQRPFSRFGLLDSAELTRHATELTRQFDVRGGAPENQVRTMSGGNMQKLVLARVLSENPLVIIANQPTWGLDVGAAAFVHRRLIEASRNGAGVVVISEDLDELFAVADVIQVMFQGTISPPIDPARTSAAELGLAMSGQRDIVHSLALREARA